MEKLIQHVRRAGGWLQGWHGEHRLLHSGWAPEKQPKHAVLAYWPLPTDYKQLDAKGFSALPPLYELRMKHPSIKTE